MLLFQTLVKVIAINQVPLPPPFVLLRIRWCLRNASQVLTRIIT